MEADLTGANLTVTNLAGANLQNAILTETNPIDSLGCPRGILISEALKRLDSTHKGAVSMIS